MYEIKNAISVGGLIVCRTSSESDHDLTNILGKVRVVSVDTHVWTGTMPAQLCRITFNFF